MLKILWAAVALAAQVTLRELLDRADSLKTRYSAPCGTNPHLGPITRGLCTLLDLAGVLWCVVYGVYSARGLGLTWGEIVRGCRKGGR